MVNTQGVRVLINLDTREEFSRIGKITGLPITDVVIKSIEHIASRQTIKVLKTQNREKVIYHPTDCIAGV